MRKILALLAALFSFGNAADSTKSDDFPPKPKWKPVELAPTTEVVLDRFKYYTDDKKSFVIFKYGTCVIVDNGLDENSAIKQGREILAKVYNYHPDVNPNNMDDGNILLQYSQPAFTVVLNDICNKHWEAIEKNHLDAICPSEVLMGLLGANKFDDFGKKILFGRCFMFLDAQNNSVAKCYLLK